MLQGLKCPAVKGYLMSIKAIKALGAVFAMLFAVGVARADGDQESVALFKKAGESRKYFDTAYAYAVFPTIGEGGIVVGGAYGKGRVYVHGRLVGDTSMTQLSAGFQLGGKAYSQIIFFQDKHSLDEFQSGTFEFSAGASAIAITAAAQATAGTNGVSAGASGTENNATTTGSYNKGMVVFTVAKGGLMYAATIAGQKFTYKPHGT